jgi:cbb3-type cytochrome c oxidase subunit III
VKKIKFIAFISLATLFVAISIAYVAATEREVAASASAVDAKALFDSKCAKCHGKDGRAKSLHAKHEHARDLTAAEWQSEASDERIFNSITNGKGKMPAFKKKLTDEQIDALAAYVRRLRR